MKCKRCDGEGVITFNKTDKNGYFNDAFFMKECPECGGTGEVKMTEQEWLQTATTEQLAEWLFKFTYKCYWCGREYTPRSISLYNEKECPFKKCMKDKKDFEKWLKEKHNE